MLGVVNLLLRRIFFRLPVLPRPEAVARLKGSRGKGRGSSRNEKEIGRSEYGSLPILLCIFSVVNIQCVEMNFFCACQMR